MKPDGQIPAYEWNFSDVNPPVHAWYVNDLPISSGLYLVDFLSGPRLGLSRLNVNFMVERIYPFWKGYSKNCC
jgi:hypothetical protein